MAFPRTRKNSNILILIVAAIAFVACSGVKVPDNYTQVDQYPGIYPDYVNVTIPKNIAPMNFMLGDAEQHECVAELTAQGKSIVAGGTEGKVRFDLDEWHQFISAAAGTDVKVRLYVNSDGQWKAYKSFDWHVAEEEIDSFVSYRLIPPSYSCYEELSLCQRDLTSFATADIYNNRDNANGASHCINCHSFQNYDTKRMQFHARGEGGGTLFYDNGKVSKRDLKRSSTISSGVYPSWHPTLSLVAYSTNNTMQNFHSAGRQKVEVQDTKSDLILYDVANDKVIPVSAEPLELEVFPSWSADGKWLYYSSASVADTTAQYMGENYASIRYNIYRRSFDAKTLAFGEPELLVDAASDSLSALLPRISPDGRYMLYSVAPYGVFHIWHEEADLYVKDLISGETHPLTEANSSRAESYHNWSSNGRWITFTSRRNDGNFTRLYFSYVDKNGNASKAFELPQEDPSHELTSMLGYNVPEFTKTKIKSTVAAFRKLLRK